MRHGKCLLAVWLASTMLAGCGDSKMVKARKELGRRVDEARRLHSHAVALLANPAYVDTVTGQGFPSAEKVLLKPDSPLAGRIGGSVVGKVTRVGATYRVETRTGKVYTIPAAQVRSIEAYPVPDAEIKVPTQPIEPQRSIKLLERARKLLEEALADWPEAPVGSRADVAQLLGDVEYARGRFIADAAQRLRRQAEDMHVRARTLLRTARNRAVVVSFNRKLAAMPREKLLALREQTQKTLAAKNAEVKALDAKIVRLQNDIQALAAKNKALTRRIRQLRARSELATGRKRLELAKQAHVLERQENANTGQIEAKRDSIANLTVDRAFARRAAQAAQARLQVLEQSLSDMAKVKQDSDRAGREAGAGVERTMRKVGALAAKVVEHCRSVLEREGAALEAMAAAAKHYGAACEYLRAESQAAVEAINDNPDAKNKIAEGLADEKHLAAVMAAKASAHLAMAEIRSRQLLTANENAALAGRIAATAKAAGLAIPAVVAQLRAFKAKDSETRELAEKDYKAAEDGLLVVLRSHLDDRTVGRSPGEGIGRNIRWIYQGQLADTYLGHYRLTGDKAVLAQAQEFVDKALEGRELSPYLTPVRRLKALITDSIKAKGAGS